MAEMKSKPRVYRGKRISVSYDVSRCMHAAECIKGGLTGVFDRERRPWVLPDGANPERVVDVVERCPSGALHYERQDGAPEEAAETNSVRPQPQGALYLRGELTVRGADGDIIIEETRLALCRCGHSQNKPFCDFSHHDAGFDDRGVLGNSTLLPDVIDTEAPLEIEVSKDGPLLARGPFALRSADLASVHYGDSAKFCRCGQSGNKPFCDMTHRRVGFTGE